MVNTRFKNIDQMKDPVSHFVYDLMTGYGMPKKLAFSFIRYGARDHSRVPMAWDSSVNGGFNQGQEPWQCVNPVYKDINIMKDLGSDKSIYRFYQKLLAIKKNNPIAIYGETNEYDPSHRRVIAYSRSYEGRRLFVVGNFSASPVAYTLPSWLDETKVLIDNYSEMTSTSSLAKEKGAANRQTITSSVLHLKPYQAVVLEEI